MDASLDKAEDEFAPLVVNSGGVKPQLVKDKHQEACSSAQVLLMKAAHAAKEHHEGVTA